MGLPTAGQTPGGGVAYPASTACPPLAGSARSADGSTSKCTAGQSARAPFRRMSDGILVYNSSCPLKAVPALSQPLPPSQYLPFGRHSEMTRTAAMAQVA